MRSGMAGDGDVAGESSQAPCRTAKEKRPWTESDARERGPEMGQLHMASLGVGAGVHLCSPGLRPRNWFR